MLVKITEYFRAQLSIEVESTPQQPLQLAAAALLIELSRADFQHDSAEQAAIKQALKACFGLSEQQLDELIALAEEENRQATSLYQFTRLINDHYSPEQKYQLVKMLWQVAAADGNICKYEDHLVRKVADLIYVSHRDFIRAKHEVLG